jgi:signal transduction histidine kinase
MRSLRTILLVNLGLLTAASLLLVSVSAVVLAGGESRAGLAIALSYGAGALLVFLVFGAWLVRRMILTPLDELARTADLLATGDLQVPELSFEGREFKALEERFRAMARRLLESQDQVVRAEKLAAIGRLSTGLAHEIRNPLGALNTYVEVLKQRGVDAEVVGQMQHEVARMDRIVAGLLDYARPRTARSEPTDLAAAARATVDFLTRQGALKGHGVELVSDPEAHPVAADPHDLSQILVNLILNARDACPGGKIVVGVHRFRHGARRRFSDEHDSVSLQRRKGQPPPPRPSGPQGFAGTVLIVADEGPGVSDADRDRVFEPFFTTKNAGEGTGLGLAIVARAVHDAGGVVWVDRAREGGAVFKALFPGVVAS